MKVLVCGCEMDHCSEALEDKILKLMDRNDEIMLIYGTGNSHDLQRILVSAEYLNVTVYHTDRPGWYDTRNKIRGEWNNLWGFISCEKRSPGRASINRLSDLIERDFQMAEDADYGIVIWNDFVKNYGQDEAFIHMVNLIAQGKNCEVYIVSEARWVSVRDYEDMKIFVGSPGEINKATVDTILKECAVSYEVHIRPDMECSALVARLLDTVLRSTLCMERKLDLIRTMKAGRNLKYEVYQTVGDCLRIHGDWNLVMKEIRALVAWKTRRKKDTEWTMIQKTENLINALMSFRIDVDPDENPVGGWLDESF